MFLHQAIQTVLQEHKNTPLTTEQIAAAINEKRLYIKKDGSEVTPWQVAIRAASDASKSTKPLFEVPHKVKIEA